MANIVDNTQQISIFDTVKSILKNNSTLNRKFRDSDFYQFEPNLKSFSFSSLPYIVIDFPLTETNLLVMNQNTTIKPFEANIVLAVAYDARSKYQQYVNAIISEIESSVLTFENNGFYNISIDFEGTTIDEIKDKQVVVGEFTLSYDGVVQR